MWKLNPSERISHWRDFRKSLDQLPLEQALDSTAKFWQTVPFSPYYLDPDDNSMWPDPWTLIYENTYCDVAKCLGIVYTVLLTGHRNSVDIEFRRYQDPVTKYEYNLSWINQGKYILNMIDGAIVNNTHVDKKLNLIKQYTATELQLENY